METKEHITGCKLFQPAKKWILRKIRDLEPTISATDEEILNLQIQPTSKKKVNSIIYLISNFQYQTWKIRRKTTTVGNITREICTKLNIKMKNLKLENTYKIYYQSLKNQKKNTLKKTNGEFPEDIRRVMSPNEGTSVSLLIERWCNTSGHPWFVPSCRSTFTQPQRGIVVARGPRIIRNVTEPTA